MCIRDSPDIIEVMKKEDHMLEWGEEIYELRTESIIEHGEKSGMMPVSYTHLGSLPNLPI